MGVTINNKSTTTDPPHYNGQQPKPPGRLNTFYWYQIFLWESVIVLCSLLYVHSSIAIILMGKRELAALLNLSSWCLVMVEWLFRAVPSGCLRFVIVVFPDHTHCLLNIFIHLVHWVHAFKT